MLYYWADFRSAYKNEHSSISRIDPSKQPIKKIHVTYTQKDAHTLSIKELKETSPRFIATLT